MEVRGATVPRGAEVVKMALCKKGNIEFDIDGRITIRLIPKNINACRLIKLLKMLDFRWMEWDIDTFEAIALTIVHIFTNIKKRAARLLEKKRYCPNCKVRLIASQIKTETGLEWIKYSCAQCGYAYYGTLTDGLTLTR